ncbi:MAG: biotin carboxylase N-terminal domain-containing protein [Nocardioides sp.]
MITRLLVANRGEIASRVFATCRRLGVQTVAVHSPADAGLPFVADADYAVALPGNAPADSYLRIDAILDAARAAGADAVHPGYGFLAENAGFARAVVDAGLTWVGPTPESIEAMGDKVRAKALMREAGVPVLNSLDPDALTEADLPVLVKAAAGGGGRGMRVVRALADLTGELEVAQAEAASAFGDGTVFVEPYVERARHVEVQVVGGPTGIVQVFGERDCSIQRRHQKVVEEAPAPRLPEDTRADLHRAAAAAATAVAYRGAGTVEFLYDPGRDAFWFLEVNTRLQVEHPVTEAVFGVDLVEAQLTVAEGRALPVAEEHPGGGPHRAAPAGHAVEVRLYAEDPADGYRPQTGRLTSFDIPAREGIRVDAGYAAGTEVSSHYDAMLAKVISWAPTREQAIRQLSGALRSARIHGVTTNRDQLLAALADERFVAGEVSTGLLGEVPLPDGEPDARVLMTAAAILVAEAVASRRVQSGVPAGWRNVRSDWHRARLQIGEIEHEVRWWGWPEMECDGLGRVRVQPVAGGWRVVTEVDGVTSSTDAPNARRTGPARERSTCRRRIGPSGSRLRPGSPTRPPSTRAAACSRRCRERSCRSPRSQAPRSPPASRCWCWRP